MVYALVIYALGLAVMALGFLASTEIEKREAYPLPTMLAYALWPVSVIVVIATVVWQKVILSFETHHPDGRIVHH